MTVNKRDFEKFTDEEKAAYIEMHSYQDPQKVAENATWFSSGWPKNYSQFFAGFFGLPIEKSSRTIRHPVLISSLILIFIYFKITLTYEGHNTLVKEWGFIPYEFYRKFFLTLFSSFFIHGDWMHLIGNSYYFYVFGDDVEDDMTFPSFGRLLFGGHIAGLLLHGLLSGSGNIPLIGASAGISALMGYYMIRFPQRKITFMILFFYYWAHVPAFFAFMWKFGWEFFLATATHPGHTNVALWAHIGGCLFGVLTALKLKNNHLVNRT